MLQHLAYGEDTRVENGSDCACGISQTHVDSTMSPTSALQVFSIDCCHVEDKKASNACLGIWQRRGGRDVLPAPVMSTVMLSNPQKTFDRQKIKTYAENLAICSSSNIVGFAMLKECHYQHESFEQKTCSSIVCFLFLSVKTIESERCVKHIALASQSTD